MSKKRKFLVWMGGIFAVLLMLAGLSGYQQYVKRDAERKQSEQAKRLGFATRYEMAALQKAGFRTGADFRNYAVSHPLSSEGEFAVSCSALFGIWDCSSSAPMAQI